jgi:hypothetical protein
MPYLGYITVDLGTSTSNRPQHCLLLVVPESTYNSSVPVLTVEPVFKRAETISMLTFMVTSLGLPNSPVVSLVDCCW